MFIYQRWLLILCILSWYLIFKLLWQVTDSLDYFLEVKIARTMCKKFSGENENCLLPQDPKMQKVCGRDRGKWWSWLGLCPRQIKLIEATLLWFSSFLFKPYSDHIQNWGWPGSRHRTPFLLYFADTTSRHHWQHTHTHTHSHTHRVSGFKQRSSALWAGFCSLCCVLG